MQTTTMERMPIVASAKATIELAEAYLRRASESDEAYGAFAGRISELVTLAFGRIADEADGDPNEIDEDLRGRADTAADWLRDMAA